VGCACILCLVQAASAVSVFVAASDSSDLSKSQADYICDGVHDEVEIQAAFGVLPTSGGEVVLSEGTFHCAPPEYGGIYPTAHSTFRGQGEDKTFLEFTTFRSSVRLENRPVTNGGEYITCSDFTITGTGHLSIYSSHHTIRNVTVYDVDNMFQTSFFIYAYNKVIEDIEFVNCKAIDCDRYGFANWGDGTVRKVKNIRYINCQAINCGRYDQFDGYGDGRSPADSWDPGFSVSETAEAEDVLLMNCVAEGCWEAGFHTEYSATKPITNLRYVNCISRDNGQKEKAGYDHCYWGAGFVAFPGVTIENCTSEDNKYGYYSSLGGCTITGSTDTGSQMGFVFFGVNKAISVTSCEFSDETYPIFAHSAITAPVTIEDTTIDGKTTVGAGSGFYIQTNVPDASKITVKDSVIRGAYTWGVNNRAISGKVNVDNVYVDGAATSFYNCNVLSEAQEPVPTPTPTPTPMPVTPTPTPTPVPTFEVPSHEAPGRILAADYDVGGEGVGYHDTTTGNTGGVYRSDDVDISERSWDEDYLITQIADGEWLSYTVNVSEAGTYNATGTLYCVSAGRSATLSVDGEEQFTATVTPGAEWTTPVTFAGQVAFSAAGEHELKVRFNGGDMNVRSFDLEKAASPATEEPTVEPTPEPTEEPATGDTPRITLTGPENGVVTGESGDYDLVLDSAPEGVAGYIITLGVSDGSVAAIEAVDFPDWATLNNAAIDETGTSAVIRATDLEGGAEPGATDLTLATVRITGVEAGETGLTVTVNRLDAETGAPVTTDVVPATITVTAAEAAIAPFPGQTASPTDPDDDGLYEDVNGNGRIDYGDVIVFSTNLTWIAANTEIRYFDFNSNNRIDFADAVLLYRHI
jgi:PKD repeat protein